MEKMVGEEKGILYSRFFVQMMGYMEKKSEKISTINRNGNMTFIPLKMYYRIASWLFHLNKKDANMLLGELKDLKIISLSRGTKRRGKGIIIRVVIE